MNHLDTATLNHMGSKIVQLDRSFIQNPFSTSVVLNEENLAPEGLLVISEACFGCHTWVNATGT